MGTNFYCKTKFTTKQRDKVIKSLESIIKNLKNNHFNEDNLKVDIVNAAEVISASTGSACSNSKPSYVLKACGYTDEEIRETIRFSLSAYGEYNDFIEIE